MIESVGKELVAAIASGSNVGLEEEGGILFCGLAWMALAGASLRAHRPGVRPVAA